MVDRATALDDLLRKADQARLVGQRVANRAANPEPGVRLEVGAAAGLEAVDRLEQPERSFLDEILDRKAEAAIPKRDRANEREVIGNEGVSRAVVRARDVVRVCVIASCRHRSL